MLDTSGMVCPFCNKVCGAKTIDSRRTDYGRRRRRECEFCGKRFTTIEFPIMRRSDLYRLYIEKEEEWKKNNENSKD